MLDDTHDPARRSFVAAAAGSDFPLQNLPLGVFSPADGVPRTGVAIGDQILDLKAALAAGLIDDTAAATPPLNAFLALGAEARRTLRRRLSVLLSEGSADEAAVRACLRPQAGCTMHLPVRIGDYTDFYVGIHHATRIGSLFRPDSPLLPNYKHVPIGYHGRASSIVPSGTPLHRPNGQTRSGDAAPTYGPTRRLDFELEIGVIVGPGNALGEPVAVAAAADHVAGFCLLNDWSARDVQAWESQPLGPFLSKSFGSTVSPWIVTPEALAPFRTARPARPAGDPAPLAYLHDDADARDGALDVALEVLIRTPAMAAQGLAPTPIAVSNTRHMYWTVAQMLAHHASGGCNLQPGDLLGSGTLSGPDTGEAGSLMEATDGGKRPIRLPSGEGRTFLEDGDEIILRGRAGREGFIAIGFGDCGGKILPARPA